MSTSNGFRLRLRNAPALRVEMDGILPTDCASCSARELAVRPIRCGNDTLELGALFDIAPLAAEAPTLVIEGDLARFDNIGRDMDGGVLRVTGDAGDQLGSAMRSGQIMLEGSAGDFVACEMAGGQISIAGSVGDYAAGALPGSMDGMRGGTLVVSGNAAERLGDRMRRGTVVVHGDVGAFAASRMVAGTIALGGAVGVHCGYGMRRGSLVFAGPAPLPSATFVPTHHDIGVFWQLLARSLAYHGGAFAGLASRRPQRLVGDLAADGRGEWLVPA